MIVAKTKLKKIPDKCLKCKFCIHTSEYNKAQGKWDYIIHTGRTCLITGAKVPYVYNEAKRKEMEDKFFSFFLALRLIKVQ